MATTTEHLTTIDDIRYRFSADEYHQMAEAGLLAGGSRFELIEGDIVQMRPIGGPHANCVDALTRLFAPLAGTDSRLRVQNAVQLSDHTEVQPDISIVRERVYGNDLPGAEDVLLLIEVADSTLQTDRDTKMPLYARAGIPQSILVDVAGGFVWHFSEPHDDGYRVARKYASGNRFAVTLTPTVSMTIHVDDLFAA